MCHWSDSKYVVPYTTRNQVKNQYSFIGFTGHRKFDVGWNAPLIWKIIRSCLPTTCSQILSYCGNSLHYLGVDDSKRWFSLNEVIEEIIWPKQLNFSSAQNFTNNMGYFSPYFLIKLYLIKVHPYVFTAEKNILFISVKYHDTASDFQHIIDWCFGWGFLVHIEVFMTYSKSCFILDFQSLA